VEPAALGRVFVDSETNAAASVIGLRNSDGLVILRNTRVRAPRSTLLHCHLTFQHVLLSSQKSNPRCKRTSIESAIRRVVRGVNVVVHERRILPISNVFRHAPQGEGIATESESEFQSRIERKVRRKAIGICCTNDLLILIHRGPWEPGVIVERVNEIEALEWCRKPSPTEEPIWDIPRKRPAHLRAEDRIV